MIEQMQANTSDLVTQSEEYSKSQRLLKVLLAMLIFLPWFSVIAIGFAQPLVAISSGFVIAIVLLCVYSFSQARMERKYRHVSATQRDYFVANIPLYFIGLAPGLAGLGFLYMIPTFGLWTILYVDATISCIYLVSARFPISLRIGQKATRIVEGSLTTSFRQLSRKMDVENVELYSVDWKRFKVANAFQVGPRKFTVYISNYLLEQMPADEVALSWHMSSRMRRKNT